MFWGKRRIRSLVGDLEQAGWKVQWEPEIGERVYDESGEFLGIRDHISELERDHITAKHEESNCMLDFHMAKKMVTCHADRGRVAKHPFVHLFFPNGIGAMPSETLTFRQFLSRMYAAVGQYARQQREGG